MAWEAGKSFQGMCFLQSLSSIPSFQTVRSMIVVHFIQAFSEVRLSQSLASIVTALWASLGEEVVSTACDAELSQVEYVTPTLFFSLFCFTLWGSVFQNVTADLLCLPHFPRWDEFCG
jgi:hypothetical protein